MKFKDLVNRIAEGVQITISIKVFGIEFSTTHYGSYYRNREGFDEIMEKEISKISVRDGVITLTFE